MRLKGQGLTEYTLIAILIAAVGIVGAVAWSFFAVWIWNWFAHLTGLPELDIVAALGFVAIGAITGLIVRGAIRIFTHKKREVSPQNDLA